MLTQRHTIMFGGLTNGVSATTARTGSGALWFDNLVSTPASRPAPRRTRPLPSWRSRC